jgi:hypothetical protein
MVVTVAAGLAACSKVPVSTGHPMEAQRELSSNSHWHAMAKDTGTKLALFLEDRMPPGALIYVQSHAGNSDFGRIFRVELVQELRDRGLTVVPTKAQATHQLAFGTRVSDHDIGDAHPRGELTLLAAGLWGLTELAAVGPWGATATAGAAFYDLFGGRDELNLSEVTVSVSILGPEGGETSVNSTYYVARDNAHHYPELAMPPMYAPQGRALPEPPVAQFVIE